MCHTIGRSLLAVLMMAVLSVESIAFTGYISDTICLTIINNVDFTNITLNAPNHSLACLNLQYCIDSGFTIMEYKEAENIYAAKYQVAASDVPKVVAVLTAATCKNNFTVSVTGTEGSAATFASANRYNGGALSFGTILNLETIEGICGGDIEAETTPAFTAATPLHESSVVAIAVVVSVVVISLAVIIAFELVGRKAETPSVHVDSQEMISDDQI